jgi:hypothetical protein
LLLDSQKKSNASSPKVTLFQVQTGLLRKAGVSEASRFVRFSIERDAFACFVVYQAIPSRADACLGRQ